MIYVDTSVFVTAITAETGTASARSWLGRYPPATLCMSGWVVTEFSSALAMKLRRGELSSEHRMAALNNWRVLRADTLSNIPVLEDAFAKAASFMDAPQSVLRAGDALHLAIASLGGHSLATLDIRLAEAALRAGVAVEEVA